MAQDLTGKQLGPFRLVSLLGRGAMGAVYLGRHKERKQHAAVKVIDFQGDPNPKVFQRFEREIELLKRFRHQNIVKYLGDHQQDGIRYYAMEFVEGESLEQMLNRKQKFSFKRASHYVAQICDALQEMHSEGVVHRDLKPANVLVTPENVIKLTDFGIAKDTSRVYKAELTEADTTVGTVAYMAPEQLAGKELSRRSDLYSLGIIFYQILTGKLPFSATTVFDYINQRQQGVFPKPSAVDPSIPMEFDDLICEMMQLEPEDRPKDAYVVMQRLREIMDKARQGTLTRTSLAGSGGEFDATQEMQLSQPGSARSLTNVLKSTFTTTLFGGKRKKKKRSDAPFWESAWFLVVCLGLILAFAAWMLKPLSEEQLFARGEALMGSEYRADWDSAMEKYFTPLLEKYPDSQHRPRIEQYRDQIAVTDAQKKVEMAHRLGSLPADAHEAFRKYFEADNLGKLLGDKSLSNRQFQSITVMFDENDENARPWVLLARTRIESEQAFDTDVERVAKKREVLEANIAKAEELRMNGKIEDFLLVTRSIINLYGADDDVKDLVAKAKALLEKAEEALRGS